jgi:hypothetical protein
MTSTSPNQKLVVIYSHITIWAVVYGILIGHVPMFIGHPWSTCDNCSSKTGCLLVLHLFDVSFSLFNLYVAWYGLKRYTADTKSQYISLLGTVISVNLVFFSFECISIILGLKAFAPAWENILVATIALMLMGSIGLALYIKQKLIQST